MGTVSGFAPPYGYGIIRLPAGRHALTPAGGGFPLLPGVDVLPGYGIPGRGCMVCLDGIHVLGQPGPELLVLRPKSIQLQYGPVTLNVPASRVPCPSMMPVAQASPSRSMCWA